VQLPSASRELLDSDHPLEIEEWTPTHSKRHEISASCPKPARLRRVSLFQRQRRAIEKKKSPRPPKARENRRRSLPIEFGPTFDVIPRRFS
jgi:hypothetical protein